MKFAKIRNVKSPVRGTDKAAGIDFFVPNFGSNKGFIVNPTTDDIVDITNDEYNKMIDMVAYVMCMEDAIYGTI